MGESKLKHLQREEMLLSCAGVQTAGGRVRVRWETDSAATPMGQLANTHATARRLHPRTRQKHFLGVQTLQFRLTHRVTPSINVKLIACQRFRQEARHQLRFLG